jgi:hypothetical protein
MSEFAGALIAVLILALLQPYLPWTRSYQRRQARDRIEQAQVRRELGLVDMDAPPPRPSELTGPPAGDDR